MIITAVVQHKGNTLVVDLPRDRMDLEVKLRSIGISILSDKIHIVDAALVLDFRDDFNVLVAYAVDKIA